MVKIMLTDQPATSIDVYTGTSCNNFSWKAYDDGSDNLIDVSVPLKSGEKLFIVFWNDPGLTTYDFGISEGPTPEGILCDIPKSAMLGENISDHTGGYDQWVSYPVTKDGWYKVSNCADTTTETTSLEVVLGTDCNYNWMDDQIFSYCDNKMAIIFQAKSGDNLLVHWFGGSSYAKTYKWMLEEIPAPQGATCSLAKTASLGSNTVDHQSGTFDQWFSYTSDKDAIIEVTQSGVLDASVEMISNDCDFFTFLASDYAPCEYTWSTGAKSEDISGLAAGPYEVVVKDANECSMIKSIEVIEKTGMNVSFIKTNSTCGSSDGSVKVSVFGGTGPYAYKWKTGETTLSLANLQAGLYEIIVTDSLGCKTGASMAINDKNSASIIIDSVNQSSCGSSDADIYVSVNGEHPLIIINGQMVLSCKI